MSQNPIAIVTGAGGAIGHSIACKLASQQWTVIVNDVDESRSRQTAEKINRNKDIAITHREHW